jgi:uncharacterized protein (TIGR02265 family)
VSESRFRVDAGVPLAGNVAMDEMLGIIPATLKTKGIFYTPLVDKLGADWSRVVPTLEAPPRFGRYLSFNDYPSRDHLRVIDAAARARLAALPTREAHRALGRTMMEELSGASVGRAVLKLVGAEAPGALMSFPRMYGLTVTSQKPLLARALDGGGVAIVFDEPLGGVEYVIGVLEAIVKFFGHTPRIDVHATPARSTFDVRWASR